MSAVDPLSAAKAAALSSLDLSSPPLSPSATSARLKDRRREPRTPTSTADNLPSNSSPSSGQNPTQVDYVTPSAESLLQSATLPPELHSHFAHVLRRFTSDKTPTPPTSPPPSASPPTSKLGTNPEHDSNGNANHPSSPNSPSRSPSPPASPKISRRQRKDHQRNLIAQLKSLCPSPEVVDLWDVTAVDPIFLVHLKSLPNSVRVPDNWRQKRKYLQGKRGMEKKPFQLPAYIADTGVGALRDAQIEADDKKTLKQKQREKMRAKTGKGVEIDTGRLHDAFFKFQTKPRLTTHGDLYYELRELEVDAIGFVPGVVGDELRAALGMKENGPPPWLVNMQRYGPPPGYPGLKVPGVNCGIPRGGRFGYHAGGWGKPPVDENGRPIYGDVFGEGLKFGGDNERFEWSEKMKGWLWGEVEEEEEVDEGIRLSVEDAEEESREEEEKEKDEKEEEGKEDGGLSETRIESGGDDGGIRTGVPSGQLYRVLEQREMTVGKNEMMGSSHVYNVRQEDAEQGGNSKETGRGEQGDERRGEKRGREDAVDGSARQKRQKEFKF
eukprot:GFKZ01007985.1.p1 GENE.GFKZ01007985.1~~GFKZ01007985.1.p1  ORF type:complete len:593 (-),score=112.57 GFKZ01007985.1:907-2565(-)